MSGNNSVVECDLAKVEVAGSNPVSRSIFFWRHSQVVRQRSAKPLFSGSNPDAASIKIKRFASIAVTCKPFFFIFGLLGPKKSPHYSILPYLQDLF